MVELRRDSRVPEDDPMKNQRAFELLGSLGFSLLFPALCGVLACCPTPSRDAPKGPVEDTTMGIPLWPTHGSVTLRIVQPPRRSSKPRPALIVFRGGAYATSSGSGAGTAQWLAGQGIVGVEVPYRTQSSGDSYPANYADAARAVRLVRSRAAELDVDPTRVGVLGYSAGGHLASLLSTQPMLFVDRADDLAASVSARPDVVVLAYPLVSFVDQYSPGAFVGSVDNFFGHRDADDRTRREFSNELNVGRDHPPVFVWTTRDDALVPATHSELFADACRKADVPVELVLFAHGPHGLGLALDESSDVRSWTEQLLVWLRRQWGTF
jgi:acetyl esterase/lipase